MAATLLLDRSDWDLCADAAGNIAMATEPYSTVQDVASACRLFINELWYGGNTGIPYFEQVLGKFRPISVLKEHLRRQALTVPSVLSARVYITEDKGRTVTGQIQITTAQGVQVVNI